MNYLRQRFIKYWNTLFPKGERTIKYTFSLLFLFVTLSGFAAVITAGGHTVRLEAVSQVLQNETFEITVYAVAKTAVNAVSIKINLPEDTYELLGVNRGESVLTLWTSDPYRENGTVYLEGGTFRKGFIGEHKIATLLVQMKSEGKGSVKVAAASFFAGDGSGIEYTVPNLGMVDFVAYNETTLPDDQTHQITLSDLNNDGKITLADISVFMSAWSTKSRLIDFDNDGKMTFVDFSIILSVFFKQNR